ncbi:MAG: PD-(D/E)XK nuclease domain-containing protein, partial [Bacteroides sp.]
ISLTEQYSQICGMTYKEIEHTFQPELRALAVKNKLSYEQSFTELTRRYDGYHFCEDDNEGLYNPFSVLSALSYLKFEDYWFATGTPTFLVEMLKQTDYDLRDLEGIEVPSGMLMNDRIDVNSPVPIIYQSGYLTIKGYDSLIRQFKLGYPNEEVKYGFFNFIAPFYTSVNATSTPFFIGKFFYELRAGEVDKFMTRLRAFFADIPYELNDKCERHYQMIFYIVFKLLGQFTDAEVQSSHGRADAVVKTGDYIYVFEFKLSGTAEEALKQIDDKEYLIPYTVDGRKLVKVGANFSKETRNIDEWKCISINN